MTPNRSPRTGWWAGAAAALLATGALLALRVLAAVPTPPELLADAVIARFPPALFSAALDLLGFLAKPLLTLALFAGQTALGALVGALAAGLLRQVEGPVDVSRASGVTGLLGLLGWLVALLVLLPVGGNGFFGLSSPPGAILTTLGYLGAAAVFAGSLAYFLGRPQRSGSRRFGRRATLGALGTVLVGGLAALLGVERIGPAAVARPAKLPSPITPVESFYVVHKNLFPVTVDRSRWALQVVGAERTVRLDLADLRALPAAEVVSTLTCISNPVGGNLIGTARWTGVHLEDLFRLAGLGESASGVVVKAWDDYADSIPLARALRPATLLAYLMDGAPLRPEHGAPLRLIVPGLYGIKNVKWVTQLALTDHGFVGYWAARGWTDRGIVQTQSQIDVPADRSVQRLGPIQVGGIAFAGDRGISRVELSADGGQAWQAARLATPLTPLTWTAWTFRWQPPKPGLYRLVVRATDGRGQLQTAEPADPIPSGATGYHAIHVRVG